MLRCYPYLLERLKSVPQVKKVLEVSELSELGKTHAPLDGAVYVILLSQTPKAQVGNGTQYLFELTFSVIYVKQHFKQTPLDGVGEALTAISRAVQGFEPVDADGNHLTTEPFLQKMASNNRVLDNFVLYPLVFATEVVI